ncbi:conserved hypothetical protein [Streptomyces sp. SPB074]|nr:conserved hypothetical protein [Streptomyces sp. SPB074]
MSAQALQPTPNQVEWAVDMAVRGELRAKWLTTGGWRNQYGLGTVDPQGLFPKPTLDGAPAGARIPANVMLGVLAQESNLWQAESGAIPGQMGNPLAAVDGYYGHDASGSTADYWKIHWDDSDCGYGVGQITDRMRLAGHEKDGEKSLPAEQQKAIAVDYTVNIAAAVNILADKWNELHTPGQEVTVNDDDPSKVENWFTAVWNYNLGFNPPDPHSSGPWGLGWYNNPANPIYKKGWGKPFMDTSVDPNAVRDAAHPQDWPYEEKVMGWSAWSIDTDFSYGTDGRQDWQGESGFSSAGLNPAWWVGDVQRSQVSPPLDTFCNDFNNCDSLTPPDCPTEECYAQYWWHKANTSWKDDCATDCGHENIKYVTLRAEPGRGTRLKHGEPDCDSAPAGSLVVASVPSGTPTWGACGDTASKGSFQFGFDADGDNHYEAKADLHQIGGGYGGRFWYAHSRDAAHLGGDGGAMTVTGTWTLGRAWAGPACSRTCRAPGRTPSRPTTSSRAATATATSTPTTARTSGWSWGRTSSPAHRAWNCRTPPTTAPPTTTSPSPRSRSSRCPPSRSTWSWPWATRTPPERAPGTTRRSPTPVTARTSGTRAGAATTSGRARSCCRSPAPRSPTSSRPVTPRSTSRTSPAPVPVPGSSPRGTRRPGAAWATTTRRPRSTPAS